MMSCWNGSGFGRASVSWSEDPAINPRRPLALATALAASVAAVASAAVIGEVARRAARAVPTVRAIDSSALPSLSGDSSANVPQSEPALSASARGELDLAPKTNGSTEVPQSAGVRARGASTAARDPAGPLASGEDPKLVLQAIRALRHSGDPAAASALLGEYLRLHPQGALAEDALALSIEAAGARHDKAAAAALGRTYLARFPNGSSRDVALRAVRAYTP